MTKDLSTSPNEQSAGVAFRKENIARYHDMIAKIAAHQPVYFADTKHTRLFDEAMLKAIILAYKDEQGQWKLLFTHP